MQQTPRQFVYALLGRDHRQSSNMYSADITIQRVEFPSEKFTYMYYGFITQGAYIRREIVMGNIELEWNTMIDAIATRLKSALDGNYPVERDFALRLAALKKSKKARDRFEYTIEKFTDSAFSN